VFSRLRSLDVPLPDGFLAWQVKLRRWTMEARHGAPHVGVAPLLVVKRGGALPTAHSIICGLLPAERVLEQKTRDFRGLYEDGAAEGARAVYDAGIAYLRSYYVSADDFDPTSVTTLLPSDAAAVEALRADPRCALVFHVFDLEEEGESGGMRCLQLECEAELHTRGPVYDNVYWHNAVFHGHVDDHTVVRFRHRRAWDTRFGGLTAVR
jgi:hypothetical protein